MKLLLHTCCAPCSVYCIEKLKEEDITPTVFWYNPNIHPYMEYKMRKETLEGYLKEIGVEGVFDDEYGLREFTKQVIENLETRCHYCYQVRLEKTAKYAKKHGFTHFTTTLLISPYQNHEQILKIGNQIAEKHGIIFLNIDFREGFRQGQQKARELGLYMQKYCGCIFSEEERFYPHTKNKFTVKRD